MLMLKGPVGKAVLFLAFLVVFAGLLALLVHGHNVSVLNPQGLIATKQRQLMVITTLLGLIVIIPVFTMTFWFAWKYRASNTTATYTPDWEHNRLLEAVWWGIPCAIILILATITWVSSHQLDPYRPLDASTKPLTVQVIALQWKWLFIYPEQGIATVNYLEIPNNTPINFQITADAPMNSFWIPQLGGQVYAMPGMSTQLHLMATRPGAYDGSSANLSGNGFASMKFKATAVSPADFKAWVSSTQQSPAKLNLATYNTLAQPSQDHPPSSYAAVDTGLYDKVIMKYMSPQSTTDPSTATTGAH